MYNLHVVFCNQGEVNIKGAVYTGQCWNLKLLWTLFEQLSNNLYVLLLDVQDPEETQKS